MFFFSVCLFHFWTRPSKWWQNFALTNAFSFGSNSVLREDQCNNLHQWLASVRLTCFWFYLEFCYGQEKQKVFVQVFLKLNKVSIVCSFLSSFFCGKLSKSTQQQCHNKELPFTLTCIYIKVKLSFWNYRSRQFRNQTRKMTETCKIGCIDAKLFTFSKTKDVSLKFKTGIFDFMARKQ